MTRDIDPDTVETLNYILDKHRDDGSHEGTLSPKELLVVQHLSHGLTMQMIGETIGRAQSTIESHQKSARQKLNAKNGAHLVAIALRNGLIE